MNLEWLKQVKTCIVHKDCADGMASALLLHDVLPQATIRFVQYGTQEHATLPAEPGMLFADFSPPKERVHAFVEAGALVLDHHKTAKDVVTAFGERGVFGDESTQPGICGATLVFDHVWLPMAVELSPLGQPSDERIQIAQRFASLAGVRDTWQRQDSRWTEACHQAAVLTFFPWEEWAQVPNLFRPRELYSEDSESFLDAQRKLGALLVAKHEAKVKEAITKAYRFTSLRATRVIVFEGLSLTSDAAEMLGDKVDLVVGFGFTVEMIEGHQVPKMILSTRSHTTFDCAAFAKANGGGGHTKAAGYSLVLQPQGFKGLSHPYDTVFGAVTRYLIDGTGTLGSGRSHEETVG